MPSVPTYNEPSVASIWMASIALPFQMRNMMDMLLQCLIERSCISTFSEPSLASSFMTFMSHVDREREFAYLQWAVYSILLDGLHGPVIADAKHDGHVFANVGVQPAEPQCPNLQCNGKLFRQCHVSLNINSTKKKMLYPVYFFHIILKLNWSNCSNMIWIHSVKKIFHHSKKLAQTRGTYILDDNSDNSDCACMKEIRFLRRKKIRLWLPSL